MRLASLLALLTVSSSFGCSGATSAPRDDSPSDLKQAPVATVTASASAPAAVAPAAETEVKRITVDAPATLARLPEKAAMYGWARPASADVLFSWTSQPGALRREIEHALPEGSVRGLLEAIGIDPGAPIAFAVTGPERAGIEKVLKAVAGGKTMETAARDLEASPPGSLHLRLVARGAPGTDVVGKLERRAKDAGIEVVRCPDEKLCAAAGADTKLVLMAHEWMAAVAVDGTRVEIDAVAGRDTVKRLAFALGAKRKAPAGGPKARCTALDAESDLAVCIDADQAAELGATMGMFTTFAAVASNALDAKSTREIVKEGTKESLRNIELSKPKRPLLDDGTVSVRVAKDGFAVKGSWELTKNSKAGVEAKLAEAKCSKGDNILKELLPTLVAAFGDRGADFAKPEERLMHVREAGFGGSLVSLARTWPNLLGVAESPRFRLGRIPPLEACARANRGRLEVEATGEKFPIAQF